MQMKLCRFDLLSDPGVIKSGFVHGGKVYETDGSNAIAVYDWADTRLLTPIGLAPSVRLFDTVTNESDWSGMSEGRHAKTDFTFAYLNPSTVIGPQTETMPVSVSENIGFKACLGIIVAASATLLTPDEAEDAIIGMTLVNIFFAADIDRMERVRGAPPGRSHDLGIAIGPAITTLDECEEAAMHHAEGKAYQFVISATVNDVEAGKWDTSELPFTPAEAVSFASESCAIRSGDLVCITLGEGTVNTGLETGDTVKLISDRLGTLANRIG